MAIPLDKASNSIPVEDNTTPLYDQLDKIGLDLISLIHSLTLFMSTEKENIPPFVVKTINSHIEKANFSTTRLSLLLKHPDVKKTKVERDKYGVPVNDKPKSRPKNSIAVCGPGMPILGPYESIEDASNALMLAMLLSSLSDPSKKCPDPDCKKCEGPDSDSE